MEENLYIFWTKGSPLIFAILMKIDTILNMMFYFAMHKFESNFYLVKGLIGNFSHFLNKYI
jgi:hypothetical protein